MSCSDYDSLPSSAKYDLDWALDNQAESSDRTKRDDLERELDRSLGDLKHGLDRLDEVAVQLDEVRNVLDEDPDEGPEDMKKQMEEAYRKIGDIIEQVEKAKNDLEEECETVEEAFGRVSEHRPLDELNAESLVSDLGSRGWVIRRANGVDHHVAKPAAPVKAKAIVATSPAPPPTVAEPAAPKAKRRGRKPAAKQAEPECYAIVKYVKEDGATTSQTCASQADAEQYMISCMQRRAEEMPDGDQKRAILRGCAQHNYHKARYFFDRFLNDRFEVERR